MTRGIIIFGASGSGTTTIAKELAKQMGFVHLDIDDYYWIWDHDVPYTKSVNRIDRIKQLHKEIDKSNYFIMSGNICGWDDSFISLFDLGVFVQTPVDIRIERLHNRELETFGNRILKNGDMYENHVQFLEWAKSYDNANPPQRCLKLHEDWSKNLPCSLLHINGSDDLAKIIEMIIQNLKPKLPNGLNQLLSNYTCHIIKTGCSNAQVYHYKNASSSYFLKIDKTEKLMKEHAMLLWLDGLLPIPKVEYFFEFDNSSYLLMSEAEGSIASDNILGSPKNTIKLLAKGILMIQSIPINDCPYNYSLKDRLEDALVNIEQNLVDINDFEEENNFVSPIELYNYLINHMPTEELCLSHGDYCLSNIFINKNQISGFIDLGRAGIAEKWQDIALCVRCLGYKLGSNKKNEYVDLLFKELRMEPNWDKINYYILLDELF